MVGSAPVGMLDITSGQASSVIPTPVFTVPAVVTAGESSVSVTSSATTSSTSEVSSVAPPQATRIRARIEKIMIPCLRNGFIFPPYY